MRSEDPAQTLHALAVRRAAEGNTKEATALGPGPPQGRPDPGPAGARTSHNLAILYDLSGQSERAAQLWTDAQALAGSRRMPEVVE